MDSGSSNYFHPHHHTNSDETCSTLFLDYNTAPLPSERDIADTRQIILASNFRLPAVFSRDIVLNFTLPESSLYILPSRLYLRLRVQVWKDTEYVELRQNSKSR